MPISPYLFFEGRAEEAAAFYRRALGAEVTMLMRYKDSPEPPDPAMPPHGTGDKVMHMSLQIGDASVMGSDGFCQGNLDFRGFALSLTVPDADEAEHRFNALADGGQVRTPLAKTFFSARFGMVEDRFGLLWMVYVAP